MYEGEDTTFEDDAQPEEESSNRTFLIAAGILAGIVFISIACLAGYLLFFRGGNDEPVVDAGATTNAQINAALTATMQAQLSMPSATATATNTSVLALASETPTSMPFLTNTPDPATATVAAGLTQVANAKLTPGGSVPTGTRLPNQLADTGFLDDFGVPGMIVMGLAMVIVIMVARRLREVPANIK
jgi:hypothetical protein